MINEFIINDINNAVGILKKMKLTAAAKPFDAVVVADEHPLSYLLCGMLLHLKLEGMQVTLVTGESPRHPASLAPIAEAYPELHVVHGLDAFLQNPSEKPRLIFTFANLRLPEYQDPARREEKLLQLRRLLALCGSRDGDRLQLITCIPSIDEALPPVTNAIAEREYEVIFRDKPDTSPEKFVLRLEDCIRSYPELLPRTQVLRLDRVYGPGISDADGLWVLDVIREIVETGSITTYDRDRHDIASASYVRDALVGIVAAMLSGRKGNIYHVSSHVLSRFQIIAHLMHQFPDLDCALNTVHEGWDSSRPKEYRVLNARKLRLAHPSKADDSSVGLPTALKATMLWFRNVNGYIPMEDTNVYYGRMPRIRQIELDVLDEVDAICKANNIPYFLTAGTMLGALRHGEFIPWDDDVDIGMLPEDYFRFLKVCPDHLSVDYGYQNFGTEETSHYIHDKIRVKNTFFSTAYSNQYPMMNGVYIDVFVYFKTSNIPAIQKFHLWYIQVVRRIIGLRWADRPRKHLHYYKSMIALPILRLFPFAWLHKYYIHVLSWFEKTNSRYRVDSMGFNLKKVGAVPDEWFHGTVEAEFCGKKYPILARYDDFCKHWYGQRYMDLLPVSSRKSVHDVVRIDLGQTMFPETMHDPRFRDVDLRGELYETYKD